MKLSIKKILIVLFVAAIAFSILYIIPTFPKVSNYNPKMIQDITESCFAVAGDTHIGLSDGSLLKDILNDADHRNLAFILVNGDLTQNSLPQEYSDYVKIISDSDIPVISVLGNHDIRHGGINLFKEYFGKTYFSFNYADYKIIVMDASKRTISSSQLIWLENELKESDKSIVLAHIPAFKTPEISGEEYALKNGDELLKLFETYPPELVIFSHTHESDFAIKGETKYLFIDSAGGRMLESRDSYGYVSICIKGDVSYQRINLLPEH